MGKKPEFGDFLLYDGTFVSTTPTDKNEIKGIYLYDGISLLNFSPKKKMFRKAHKWCLEHGGYIPSVKTLFFIVFHFDEINRLRESVGEDPLPRNLTAWTSNRTHLEGYTYLNYVVDFAKSDIRALASECALIDDCGTANTICVLGEPKKV